MRWYIYLFMLVLFSTMGYAATCNNCAQCNALVDNTGVSLVEFTNDMGTNSSYLRCIDVYDRTNLIIDCNNYTLFGQGTNTNHNFGIVIGYSSNIQVRNCSFTNFSYVSGNTGAAINISDSKNIYILNSTFYKLGSSAFYHPIYLDENISFTYILNNNFVSTYYGVRTNGGTGTDNFSNSFIIGNKFNCTAYDIDATYAGDHNVIKANTFNGTATYSLYILNLLHSNITYNNFTVLPTSYSFYTTSTSTVNNLVVANSFLSGIVTFTYSSSNTVCSTFGNWYSEIEGDERIWGDCGPNPDVSTINIVKGDPSPGVIFGQTTYSRINYSSIGTATANAPNYSFINISQDCFEGVAYAYRRDGLIIQGSGFNTIFNGTKQGTVAVGFKFSVCNNCTLRNMSVTTFTYPVYIEHSNNVTINTTNLSGSSATNAASIYIYYNVSDTTLDRNILGGFLGQDYCIYANPTTGVNQILRLNITRNNMSINANGYDCIFFNGNSANVDIKWNNISMVGSYGDSIDLSSTLSNFNITENNISNTVPAFDSYGAIKIGSSSVGTGIKIHKNHLYGVGIYNPYDKLLDCCDLYGNWYHGSAGYYRCQWDCGPWPAVTGIVNVNVTGVKKTLEWGLSTDEALGLTSLQEAMANVGPLVRVLNLSPGRYNYTGPVYADFRNDLILECNGAQINDSLSITASDPSSAFPEDPVIYFDRAYNNSVHNCSFVFFNEANPAIKFTRGSRFNNVSFNNFNNTYYGVLIDYNSSNNNITHNIFSGFYHVAAEVYLKGSAAGNNVSNTIIAYNNFLNLTPDGSVSVTYQGSPIYTVYAEYLQYYRNNMSADLASYGPYITLSDENNFSDNNFSGFNVYAISFDSNSDLNIIWNNTFMSNTTKPPRDLSGDGDNDWNYTSGNRWVYFDEVSEGCIDDGNGFCDVDINILDSAAPSGIWDYLPLMAPAAPAANDVSITASAINFSNWDPIENQTITIYANVTNEGGAVVNNVKVSFYEDSRNIDNHTIPSIAAGAVGTANVSWNATIGFSNITATVDIDNSIAESSENNNNATNNISVDSYHTFAGLTQGYVVMGRNISTILFNYTGGVVNVYVADSDSVINFNNLAAIGKTAVGGAASDDLIEIDTALGMTFFNDSISKIYPLDPGVPKFTRTYTIYNQEITSVPITNSSSDGNFSTGILWDKSDDSNGEYDAENEDLVFVCENNETVWTSVGLSDYVLKVPALLRNYKNGGISLSLYIEIR